MRPETPLEIQWLAYALAVNGALDVSVSQQIHDNLGGSNDLTEFAEAILSKLCEKIDPSDEPMMIDQVQQLVDYAFEQAGSGMYPDWSSVPAVEPAAQAAPAAPAHATASQNTFRRSS